MAPLIVFILLTISAITAIFGPKSWLRISLISSFLLGMAISIWVTDSQYFPAGLILGLGLGLFLMAFSYWSGYWVRKYRGY